MCEERLESVDENFAFDDEADSGFRSAYREVLADFERKAVRFVAAVLHYRSCMGLSLRRLLMALKPK